MAKIRAFFAVDIGLQPGLRRVLNDLAKFGSALRPVSEDQLHITVKFLGDIADADVPRLARVVESILTGYSPSEHALVGLGAFPSPRRPSVVWAGIVPAEPLIALASTLEAACETVGYPREPRPFRPHLTLARVKFRPPAGLDDFLAAHESTSFGTFVVDQVTLYQSQSGPRGARYIPLARWPLTGC